MVDDDGRGKRQGKEPNRKGCGAHQYYYYDFLLGECNQQNPAIIYMLTTMTILNFLSVLINGFFFILRYKECILDFLIYSAAQCASTCVQYTKTKNH